MDHFAGFFQVLFWLLSEWPRLGFSLSISFLSLKFMFSNAISSWFQDGCPHLQGLHSVHMQKSRVYLFSQWWNWRLGLRFDLILSPVLIPETILLWPDGWGFTRHTSRDRKKVSFPKALGCEVEKLVSEPKLGCCIKNRGWILSSPKWQMLTMQVQHDEDLGYEKESGRRSSIMHWSRWWLEIGRNKNTAGSEDSDW